MAEPNFLQNLFGLAAPDPNNPFVTQAPGLPEIIARLAQTLGPLAPFIGGTRTPFGRTLGAGSVLAGGLGGTVADLIQSQRLDPLKQKMLIAQKIKELGMEQQPAAPSGSLAPFTPVETLPANGEFSVVGPGQPSGFPGVPGPPPAPVFNPSKVPAEYQIALPDVFKALQQQRAAEAEIAQHKAQTAVAQAQLPHIAAQTAETQAQTKEREQLTTERGRQQAADQTYRTELADFRKQNPKATATDLARFAGTRGAELGVSDKETKPLLDALSGESLIAYHLADIDIRKAQQAQAASQFAQSLARGELSDLRTLASAEKSAIVDQIKANQALIAEDIKLTAQTITPNDPRAMAAAQRINDARTRINGMLNPATGKVEGGLTDQLKAVQEKLNGLASQTTLGKKIAASKPPPKVETTIVPRTQNEIEAELKRRHYYIRPPTP